MSASRFGQWSRWFDRGLRARPPADRKSAMIATMGWIIAHADNTGGGVVLGAENCAYAGEIGLLGSEFDAAIADLLSHDLLERLPTAEPGLTPIRARLRAGIPKT